MNVYASGKNSLYGRGVGCVDRSERAHNQCLRSWPFAFAHACSSLLAYIFISDALQQTDARQWELLLQVITVANRRPLHALLQPAADSGATTFSKLAVQFLVLGYCTEQNADGIPSLVHCSLLRNGNHTLHQKSWGGPSKFWGVRTHPTPQWLCPWLQTWQSTWLTYGLLVGQRQKAGSKSCSISQCRSRTVSLARRTCVRSCWNLKSAPSHCLSETTSSIWLAACVPSSTSWH